MPVNMKILPEEWKLDLGKIGDDCFWAEFYKSGKNPRDERGILYEFRVNIFTSSEKAFSKLEKERFCETIVISAPEDDSTERITLSGVYLIKEVINQRMRRSKQALDQINLITEPVETGIMAKIKGPS